ncbi:VgrG-related protein [Nibrella saemangeumensis]|uniref:VgrG-related protein n=1 Tax=Nibrella saemangeumensis TaxID=1084526 RepID=A0ABP8N7K0_9BACT
MTDQQVIPSNQPKSVATFTVLSDGDPLPDSVNVLSMVVNREVNRLSSATLIIQDGQASQQRFSVSNGEQLIPGRKIEIKAGYRSDEETIFKGVVIRHSIKVRKNVSLLVVECRHEAVKMTTQLSNDYYHDQTDLAVAEQLVQKYGLTADVDGDTPAHKELVQFNCTDWDYMLCRAEANRLWVVTEDDKVSIKPPDFEQEPVLSVQFGATVKELDAEIDSRLQYRQLKAVGWDPAEQTLIDGVEATIPPVPAAGNLAADILANVTGSEPWQLRHPALPEPELKAWADAAFQKQRLSKIRGRVRIDGTPEPVPGKVFQLSGAGERFEGKLMITGVRHQLEKGNWETIMQFGEDPKWFAQTFNVPQPLSGALIPPVQGLQIGIVTDLEDPAGEDRIRVRLPMVNGADDGAWMRMVSLDAGKERGWVVRPEIGDEVMVGFLLNDPRHGVVLGMVHSSKNPAPIPASNDNHEKGFISRSELKVLFNDEKKTITLSTPAGHQFILDDDQQRITLKDSNGNKLVMDPDGITVESIKNLTLKAASNTKLEAGANAELKGGAQMKVSGGAGAELSSGANTAVKGAMVQIN